MKWSWSSIPQVDLNPVDLAGEGARVAVVLTADQRRPAGELRVEPLGGPVVEGEHVVLDGLDQPQPLQLVQLVRHLPVFDERWALGVGQIVKRLLGLLIVFVERFV